jgi:ankyrin repeat protein
MSFNGDRTIEQPELAEILLCAKADPNISDNEGNTPLIEASKRGFKEVVTMLLETGVNFNAKNNEGISALNLALSHGHYELVDLLKQFGAK